MDHWLKVAQERVDGKRRRFPRIFTRRLVLRTWFERDRQPFHQLNQDPKVMAYFPQPLAPEESDQFIVRIMGSFVKNGFGPWVVECRATGDFLGFAGLIQPSFSASFTPCIEIGWRFAAKYWRQGYATEAASAVLAFALQELKLAEIVSFTSELNEPSWRLMERLGMRRDLSGDFLHPRLDREHKLAPHRLYRVNPVWLNERALELEGYQINWDA